MIKSLFWNARGVDNALTLALLRKLKHLHQISLLTLCERMVGHEHLDIVRRKLGFLFGVSNEESRVWIFYNVEYKCDIVAACHQFLVLQIAHTYFSRSFIATFVHASCDLDKCELLWLQLSRVHWLGEPTIFMGDFNIVVGFEEKKGGRPFRFSKAESF